MASGNYTGAVYALREIIKYQPDYGDAAQLLENARRQKKAQSFRLFISLAGAILFVGIGSTAGLRNDLWLLAFGYCRFAGWVWDSQSGSRSSNVLSFFVWYPALTTEDRSVST